MAAQSSPEIVDIGIARPNPVISFVIPLYRNLSFLRLQVGAFAIDPQIQRDVELIYVLDSPEQRREVEHLLRGLNILTGLAVRLVIMAENFGYAAANNTGVRAARGRLLMLLNSDVIPLAPGWLATLCAALETRDGKRETAIVGPKLLFDDGSLQHAGLTFEKDPEGRWYNTHLFKGYPRDWPAANLPCVVPGVTGAAMLLPRATYESVGGFTENYIVGDYEDSDLCLKIRAEDREIRYEPRAALHHFERRSIELHPGYSGTVASAYNRRLHAERWSDAMAAVVAEFARGLESDRASGARAAVAGSRQ
jgi:GT2 family glycosyltransferase